MAASENRRKSTLIGRCKASLVREVSGQRLWGWARERYRLPERFFAQFFVLNYCPLAFFEESGRNRTPEHLPAERTRPLFELCDEALRQAVSILKPSWVLGVGRFTERRARKALAGQHVDVAFLSCPSPANPRTNRGWSRLAEEELRSLGIGGP